ncbi:hypothetical protein KUV50_10095 [Membranicola marinus]|uniref:Beta-galactosidase n=1 Tax=Membranihabitans marinus TaxID=1227546 RepID=A0A953LD52_9BACT|nr:hypothetical protein [Membranihabitans marinus]MBY5958484.1 hypothetical protein [Membranihabitans marinus]
MKYIIRLTSLFILMIWSALPGSATIDNPGTVQPFSLEHIAIHNKNSSLTDRSSEFDQTTLTIHPTQENPGVVIWEKGDQGDWNAGQYLVFEVFANNKYSGQVNIEFYINAEQSDSENNPNQKAKTIKGIYTHMGILPKLKTKMIFPLSYLDGQNVFMPRFPRQLKGTVWGRRLDPADIVKVVLRFGPIHKVYPSPEYEVASISITENLPPPYPPIEESIIDEFGQWKLKKWKDKIRNERQLKRKNRKVEKLAQSATYPDNWSQYGGWKEKQFEPSGYFRTEHDGHRWWLVDPEGYAFLSTGVDVMQYGSAGPVNDIEDLFEQLPEDTKNVDFYVQNLTKVYGEEARRKWETTTRGLMKKYRFNTVGNWSDITFIKNNNLPYVLPLYGFPTTKIRVFRDFPDVFSNEYHKNSVHFAKQLHDYKDDPYLIGYFLQNEPQWASGDLNIAFEMFGTTQQSETKNKFVEWIREKYGGDIKDFNNSWNLDLHAFQELLQKSFKSYPSKTADKDFYAFSEIMVSRYVDIPCDEIDKVDQNHLNLGMRYAWLSSDLLYKAGERFDAFSINGYGMDPPETAKIAEKSGKPVLIGEFHHGAVDRALPATGIVGVANQKDRGRAYRHYLEQGFSRPEVIGMHYFQWIDLPFYGRFDGENYNIGVVNMNNIPYPELTKAMTVSNERIYKVGSGQVPPVDENMKKIPAIHY